MSMFSALPVIAATPALRTATLCLLCFGVSLSSTIPFQSLIGIKELGMSDGGFAAFMFAVAVISVVVSVVLGIVSDLVANRKLLVLALAGLGTVGYAVVWLFPSRSVFIAAMMTALPLTRALFSVLFGGVRRDLEGQPADAITRVNSSIRAIYAMSWIVVPGAAAWALRDSPSLLPVFLVASLANGLLFVIYALFSPPSGTAKPAGGGGFLSSLSLLMSWDVLLRVAVIALGSGAHTLHSALHPLIMTDVAGGTTWHVGLYAGALAALEIPFMFLWAEVARRRSLSTALMLALLVYAAYCGLLGFATTPWQMFAIAILNGCGAAAVLSLPISYFQDLFADRPGLGTSLVPVMTFMGGLMGSAGFALGTAVSGYSGTAFVIGAMCLAGAAGLAVLERRTVD